MFLSNEVRHEFTVEKEQGNAVLAFLVAVNSRLTTNKTEHFSFKSGCDLWVLKRIKEDWPIVLQ